MKHLRLCRTSIRHLEILLPFGTNSFHSSMVQNCRRYRPVSLVIINSCVAHGCYVRAAVWYSVDLPSGADVPKNQRDGDEGKPRLNLLCVRIPKLCALRTPHALVSSYCCCPADYPWYIESLANVLLILSVVVLVT